MAVINLYLKGAYSKQKLFMLKKEDKNRHEKYLSTPLPILLYAATMGERIQLNLSMFIAPKFWDTEKQCVKLLKEAPAHITQLQNDLSEIKKKIEAHTVLNEQKRNNVSKNELHLIISKKQIQNKNKFDLNVQFTEFILEHKTATGFSLRKNSIKKYKTLENDLAQFEKLRKKKIDWSVIDKSLIREFQTFLIHDKKNSDNTVVKYIKALMAFLRFQKSKGINITPEVFEIKLSEKAAPVITVELNELKKLEDHEFDNYELDKVRDVFLFMAWTGQRFSDIQNLKKGDITYSNGMKVWNLSTIKTNAILKVPINDIAESILKKYWESDSPIPIFTNQYFNRLLKEVAQLVQLDRMILKVLYIDGVKIEHRYPLYQVITSHMARKSFITNSLILEMSETEVKKISGHEDDKSFKRYVNLADSYLRKAKINLSKTNVLKKIREFSLL